MHIYEYVAYSAVLLAVMLICICVGSVDVALSDTLTVIWNSVWGFHECFA